jgi:two-component system response regulator MprA
VAVRILVVDDDRAVRESLRRSLSFNGYSVALAQDGVEALDAIASDRPDALVLDVMMPRLDGLEVCRQLRSTGDDLPILVLTARDSVSERVAGLDAGADDYLVKPFDLDELAARVRAVARRRAGRSRALLQVGKLEIDTAARQVRWEGRDVMLSAREFALLEALAERAGSYLTRAQLEERLYGWDEEIASNAVEVHIHALRRKLAPGVIRNVRGLGYTIASEAP